MKTIIKYFLIVFWALFKISAQAQAQTITPEWITKYPLNSDYFIGIAYADKKLDNYMEAAKSRALQSLANEITVKIIGQTSLQTIELNQKVKQNYISSVTTETIKELEGYELVDSWQDKHQYWVYYRLSKKAYYQAKKDKANSALQIAKNYVMLGMESFNGANYKQGLNYYFMATNQIQNYLYFEYDIELKQQINALYQDAYKNVSDFYTQVNIKVPSQHIKLKPHQLNNYILNLNIQNKQSLKPIANFPFFIRVVSGQANIETNNKLVNENGNLNFKINSFGTKSKVHSFKISIDKDDLFSEYIKSNNLLAIELYKKINCETNIEIESESLFVFIKSNEKAFNIKTKEQFLANAIKSFLIQNGVSITNNIDEANYCLSIEGNTTKGNMAYNMQVVYLDATIVLNKSKNIVLNKNFNEIKGLKATELAASYDAYQKLIRKFENELFVELLNSMGLTIKNEDY
jgi:hypothetical protein